MNLNKKHQEIAREAVKSLPHKFYIPESMKTNTSQVSIEEIQKKQEAVDFAHWVAMNYKQDNGSVSGVVYNSRTANIDNKEEYLNDYFLEDLYDIWQTEVAEELNEQLSEIANTYHDRLCGAMLSMDRSCPICKKLTHSTIGIEHDSQEHSKDIHMCLSCYNKLHNLWIERKPNKISPV